MDRCGWRYFIYVYGPGRATVFHLCVRTGKDKRRDWRYYRFSPVSMDQESYGVSPTWLSCIISVHGPGGAAVYRPCQWIMRLQLFINVCWPGEVTMSHPWYSSWSRAKYFCHSISATTVVCAIHYSSSGLKLSPDTAALTYRKSITAPYICPLIPVLLDAI